MARAGAQRRWRDDADVPDVRRGRDSSARRWGGWSQRAAVSEDPNPNRRADDETVTLPVASPASP